MATVFSPDGSSEAKCRRKRATISPQSPSSVVPAFLFKFEFDVIIFGSRKGADYSEEVSILL